MTRKRRGIVKHKKSMKRVRTISKVLTLFLVICIAGVMAKCIIKLFHKPVQLTIIAEDQEILQGEELPKLTVQVKAEDKKEDQLDKIFLDQKKTYSINELIGDIRQGKICKIICNADPNTEGIYPIKVELEKKVKDKLDGEWKGKVRFYVKGGNLKVKNSIGNWEKDRFKKYDGTYVTNGFVQSKGHKYYLDGEGRKVTGWQIIGEDRYLFDENGILQKSKWEEKDGYKYYLGNSGAALKGWQSMDGGEYYFMEDGKMAVGQVKIGLSEYTFDENGKLVSKSEKKIDPSSPMVALTFDDGPGSRTIELLEQLKKYNAHATFFMLGQNVSSYPDTIRQMKEAGCELGNHSYDHANLSKMDANGIKKEVGDTNSRIKSIVGEQAELMRPPYGALSDILRESAGMPMILWNIDTLDWKTRNVQQTIDSVMDHVKDGDIILMHDIYSESIDAAIELIPKLEQEGFQLVTVSEMAEAKGHSLENGKVYTDF